MKAAQFDYRRADTLEEALGLLAELGDDAKVLAGGQSLIPLMAMRLSRPTALVDLNRVDELAQIDSNGHIEIGAVVRQCEAERSLLLRDQVPLLSEAIPYVGHPQIRNRGTIGGSLAHADPAAEMPTVMCALNAEMVLQRVGATRVVPAEGFFTGYFSTIVEPDEILTAVRIPLLEPGTGSSYTEFSRRHGDFALIGVAVMVRLGGDAGVVGEARVVLSGAGSVPVRAHQTEALLEGQAASAELWQAAAAEVAGEIDPPADLQGPTDYRRQLARTLVVDALDVAYRRAGGRL